MKQSQISIEKTDNGVLVTTVGFRVPSQNGKTIYEHNEVLPVGDRIKPGMTVLFGQDVKITQKFYVKDIEELIEYLKKLN
jgi:hypothetical protein